MLMDDIERKLSETRLAMPSASLDRRIDQALSAATRAAQTTPKFAWWWWAGAATVAATAVVLLVANHPAAPPVASSQIVYHVEAEGRLREMLLNSDAHRDQPPPFVVSATRP
jgi:hypothetical protein